MKQKKNLIAVLTLLLSALSPLGLNAAYDDVGVGARVTGMGNAFTAVADDAYAIYYNPAGLGTLDRPELATTYSKLLTGLSDNSNLQNSFLGYAYPLSRGRQGSVGVAWNYFTLDGLYRETSLYGSYGRALFADAYPDRFYAGATLKYLNRAIGSTAAADAPLSDTGVVVPGRQDPVLKVRSKTNMDADLGFLYRLDPRWSLGLMVQHVLEPNIAFSPSDTDKLGRNVKLGTAYKTPFSTLSADVGLRKAPDGTTDKVATVAAEKWLPTLEYGTFGIRGSLGLGSRDYRQVTFGLSYKIFKMEFDYGYAIPLGGISSTFGSHRIGITMRFGRPRQAEARYAESLLESLPDLARVGTPEYRYQMADLALERRRAIEEFLRQARIATSNGDFADALGKLDQAQALSPADALIRVSEERLKLAAGLYPQLAGFRSDPGQAAIYDGIMEYLAGRDREAVMKLQYAYSLNPGDERIKQLLAALKASPEAVKAPQVAAAEKAPAESGVGGAMALMEVALRDREYDKVILLANQVVHLDPTNSLAYMRMGTAYYNLGKYPEALRALRLAEGFETDPEFKRTLKGYIWALRSSMEKVTAQAPPKATLSPQEIERLYESGVDLYAERRYPEAAALFRKILDADPANVSARRALDRMETEMGERGDRR